MKTKLFMLSITVTLIFVSLAAEVAAITAKEYAVVINLSGRQRMLTQKMSKEMLLVANKVDVNKNRSELQKTAALFDKTLKGLIKGSKELGLPPTQGASTLKVMGKVEGLWSEFHSIVNSVVGGGTVPVAKVAELNLPLLKTMNTAVRLYERDAKKEIGMASGVVINLAGKQRMLTQKMSKEMLLVMLKSNTDVNRANLKKTASLFDRTLKGLKDGDKDLGLPTTSDSAIVGQLNKVKSLWDNFKPLVDSVTDIDSGDVSMEKINKMAELNLPLLKEMNKAVKMYEKAEK